MYIIILSSVLILLHSQILSRSRGKSGSGLGTRLDFAAINTLSSVFVALVSCMITGEEIEVKSEEMKLLAVTTRNQIQCTKVKRVVYIYSLIRVVCYWNDVNCMVP